MSTGARSTRDWPTKEDVVTLILFKEVSSKDTHLTNLYKDIVAGMDL